MEVAKDKIENVSDYFPSGPGDVLAKQEGSRTNQMEWRIRGQDKFKRRLQKKDREARVHTEGPKGPEVPGKGVLHRL